MPQAMDIPKQRRTCMVCGIKTAKGELYRIVRGKSGVVSFDEGGRMPGRGAYVCSKECLDKAIDTRRLDRALRTAVSNEEYDRIMIAAKGSMSVGVE